MRTSPDVKESVGDLRFFRLFPFPSLFFDSELAADDVTSIWSADELFVPEAILKILLGIMWPGSILFGFCFFL